jgi:hypothetical protein
VDIALKTSYWWNLLTAWRTFVVTVGAVRRHPNVFCMMPFIAVFNRQELFFMGILHL